VGVGFVVLAFIACTGGPGPIGEDPFGQGSSSQQGGNGNGNGGDDEPGNDNKRDATTIDIPPVDGGTATGDR
jgi:hypothetical protein